MKDAFSSYIDEVKSGNFPESKHSFALKEDIDFNNLDKKARHKDENSKNYK
mgnify:FL=1